MEIRITGKNLSVTTGIQNWVQKKVSKLEKYVPHLESHVIIKKEKYFYIAEITASAKHLRAYGEGRDKDNLYTAIDWACDRLTKQLKKFREKVKSHHLPIKGKQRQLSVEEEESE